MPPATHPFADSGVANAVVNAVVNAEDDENRRDAPEDEGDDVDNITRSGRQARVEGNRPTPSPSPSTPRKYRG